MAGINYERRRALRHPSEHQGLHELLLVHTDGTHMEFDPEFEMSSASSDEMMDANRNHGDGGDHQEGQEEEEQHEPSEDGFGSDDGLGRPVTHEGDIITPEHTPRLVNGTRMLADDGGMATWLTPGQIAYMQGEGYYVLSDKEVNRRRAELQASMPPSINEVLTPQVMNEIVEGNHAGTVQVPIDPSNWDGVEPQERDERTQLLEDCLLLAIQPEEMNNERLLESKALRAQLRTVRNVEQALRERRADRFLEFLYSADRTFFKALSPVSM